MLTSMLEFTQLFAVLIPASLIDGSLPNEELGD